MMDKMDNNINDLINNAGLKVTKQRKRIAEELFSENDKHVTAEILFKSINNDFKISLATIYNCLGDFTKVGILKEVNIEAGKTWYDTRTDNHHHFYNVETKTLIDIPEEEIQLLKPPKAPKGHKINHMKFVFHLEKNNV